jgi:hypothetical protein
MQEGRKFLTKFKEGQEGFTKKDALLSRRMVGAKDARNAL